ncbi:hypothetical protein Droror1_Dr00025799 [Drosera rotundifolia]
MHQPNKGTRGRILEVPEVGEKPSSLPCAFSAEPPPRRGDNRAAFPGRSLLRRRVPVHLPAAPPPSPWRDTAVPVRLQPAAADQRGEAARRPAGGEVPPEIVPGVSLSQQLRRPAAATTEFHSSAARSGGVPLGEDLVIFSVG